MAADITLGVPEHVSTPDNVEFSPSKVDEGQTGIFCVWPIAKGTMFGPYEGRILGPKRANKTDPRYSWLVFKLDTMKLIHIVDSTDPKYCNWLRYVCCARYLEEQNIVSIQEGDEIFYKAMRDISPGEELLTWFHSRKQQKRNLDRSFSTDSLPSTKQGIGKEIKSPAKVPQRDRLLSSEAPEREKRKRKPKIIPDSYEGPVRVRSSKISDEHLFEPLLPGQKRRRRKKLLSDASDGTVGSESRTSRSDSSDSGEKNIDKNIDIENIDKDIAHKLTEVKIKKEPVEKSEQLSLNEINSSLPDWQFPLPGTEYVFELEPHHLTTQVGRKVYKCDICYGLYKHMFSLKRHYLRNHINYKYLSKADLTNCLINLPQVTQAERNSKVAKEMSMAADTFIKQEPGDNGIIGVYGFHTETSQGDSGNIKQEVIDNEYDKAAAGEQDNKAKGNGDRETDSDLDESDKLVIDMKENVSEDTHSVNNSFTNGDLSNTSSAMDTSHLTSKDEIQSDASNAIPTNEEERMGPIAKPMTNLYRCYTCYEYFHRKADIREHTQNHPQSTTGSMAFTCDKCSMRFPYKQNLVRHKAVHEVDKPSKVKVKKEARATPTKDRNKTTDLSGSRVKAKLKGQKQFKCEKCPMKFRHSQNLIRHMVSHKAAQSSSSFPCDFCGKDFPSLSNLKKHIRFHLEYHVGCRYCTEVFSNVGALRKHIRLSHPDIYIAKQKDKLARDGVLRKPDKKTLPAEEEDTKCRVKSPTGSGKGSHPGSDTEKLSKNRRKVSKPDEGSDDFLFDNADFAAEEIDDGGSRFKYSCTICKKRFSSYLNMCRHRRKAHESKPKIDEPTATVEVKKAPPPIYETPETTALFYANVSNNIATNLNNYIDGKPESLEKFAEHINIEGYTSCFNTGEKQEVDFTWAWYNFPADYKPAETVSFSDIRNRFDIHSEFHHCEAAKTETFDSEDKTVESVKKDLGADIDGVKTVDSSKGIQIENESEVNEFPKVSNKDSETIMKTNSTKIDSAKSMETILNPDIKSAMPFSHLRKKFPNFRQDNASPATKRFKRVIDGDYVNFDDLCDMLPSDVDSPMIMRKGPTSASLTADVPNMRDTNTHEVEMDDQTEALVKRIYTPMPLSLMCEQILGLKRLEPHYWEIEQKLKIVENLQSSGRKNEMLFSTLSLSSSPINAKSRLSKPNKMTQDMSCDPDISDKTTVQNYDNIVFGKNGQVTNVCAICRKHFSDFDSLIRHHWKKHSASVCNYLEIEQGNEIENLHFSEPSTVGALAVTDPGLDMTADGDSYYCTRCSMPFETVSRLHVHIVNCSAVDPVSGEEKYEPKGKSPIKTPIKKKIKKSIQNILNGGQHLKFKLKDFAGYSNGGMPEEKPKKQLFSVSQPATPVRLIQRRSQEVLCYNPSNHIRRRELTTVIDSHNQCEACGLKFKSIILLERHVKNCSKKERFKDIQPMKCPIMEESLAKLKHICFYCDKNFTYMKSLVNHFQDFCPVKKLKLNKGQITEEERRKEEDIIENLLKQEDEKVTEDTPHSSNGKQKGWQKGVKRKSKRKGFSWTSIKKKKLSINENSSEAEVENKSDEEKCSEDNNTPMLDTVDVVEKVADVNNRSGNLNDIDEVDSGMDVVSMLETGTKSKMEVEETPPVDSSHGSTGLESICIPNTFKTKGCIDEEENQTDTAEKLDMNLDNTQKKIDKIDSVSCVKNTQVKSGTEQTTSENYSKPTKTKKLKSKSSALFQCITAMKGHADESMFEVKQDSKLPIDLLPVSLHCANSNISDAEVKLVPLNKKTEDSIGEKLFDAAVTAAENIQDENKDNNIEENNSSLHTGTETVLSNISEDTQKMCPDTISLVTHTAIMTETIDVTTNFVEESEKSELEQSDSTDNTIENNSHVTESNTFDEIGNSTDNDGKTTDNLNDNSSNGCIVSINKEIRIMEPAIISDVSKENDKQLDMKNDHPLIINDSALHANGCIDKTQFTSPCTSKNTKYQDTCINNDTPLVLETKDNDREVCDSQHIVINDFIESANRIPDTPTVRIMTSNTEENSSNIKGKEETPVVLKRRGRPRKSPIIKDDNEVKQSRSPSCPQNVTETANRIRHRSLEVLNVNDSLIAAKERKNIFETDILMDTKVTGGVSQVCEKHIQVEIKPSKVSSDHTKVSEVSNLITMNNNTKYASKVATSRNRLRKNVDCHRTPFKSCNDIRLDMNTEAHDNIGLRKLQTSKEIPNDKCTKRSPNLAQKLVKQKKCQQHIIHKSDSVASDSYAKKDSVSENKGFVKLKVAENIDRRPEVNTVIDIKVNLESKDVSKQHDKKLVSKQVTKLDNVSESKILEKSPEPSDETFEFPLSPGEYVKVNKRHCKQQVSYSYGRQSRADFIAATTLSSGSNTSDNSETDVQEDSAINIDRQCEVAETMPISSLKDNTKADTVVKRSSNMSVNADTAVRRGRKRKSVCMEDLKEDDDRIVYVENSEQAAAVLALSNEVKRMRTKSIRRNDNDKNKLDKCKTTSTVVTKMARKCSAKRKTNERNKVDKLCKFFSALDKPEQDDELFSKQTRRSKERLRQILDV